MEAKALAERLTLELAEQRKSNASKAEEALELNLLLEAVAGEVEGVRAVEGQLRVATGNLQAKEKQLRELQNMLERTEREKDDLTSSLQG